MDIWCLRCWDLLQSCPTSFYSLLIPFDQAFLNGCHGYLRCDRQRVSPFREQPGLLATNEHATAFTIKAVRTCHVELIPTVHGFPISIIANEPPEGRETSESSLHIDHSFNDAADIVRIPNDPMELEWVLPSVAPDRSMIDMSCVLS